ncbi:MULTISPECIES: PASTA domain-containing protein [Tenacibaculum]|uniref:PASTA domain-containing protein n=1 Tax=Tenacibaculum TaxID=104267 RepID=UPI001F0A3BAB|nr:MULTISPECIES: PASTA domain-containing protein [Tenacibaculum]MCH3882512.1 PASTA domain-containing protein [Tenacibaculum aquimarinum]MDO6600002.1 PASTA domain-containing protein [Tenacibaculum sp. 1_MG-2023]
MSIVNFIKSKTFFKQIAIAVVGLLLFVFVLKFWLGVTTNHNQKIQVPNLHKMSLADVQQKLEELDLDFIVIDSASFNPDYPKKSVIEQTPEAGGFVKEQRKIYLTLNPSKYRDVTIPDLNGRTKRQATSHLSSIGFKVGENYTWVGGIGKNVVRGLKYKGKRIKAGDKLPKNSVIDLILEDGNR